MGRISIKGCIIRRKSLRTAIAATLRATSLLLCVVLARVVDLAGGFDDGWRLQREGQLI